jgi:hypothetical protein
MVVVARRDPLRADDIRAYVHRAWDEVRASKHAAFAEDARTGGPNAGARASDALWADMRALDPSWPDDAQRQDDLRHHELLCEKFARLGPWTPPSHKSSRR